ncbi:MAG: TonB-dependent receptor [Pseudolabrys sp.]
MGSHRRVIGAALALSALLAQAASAQDTSQASRQDNNVALPPIDVSSSRLSGGIVGTSTTIITAEDIQRSPAQTLPDILSREPGIQVTNPYGGVNGARSVVDMRGFGAAATSNTLILIDGRRINDLDIAGVDLASIPRDSIDHIEITRGNSGVVLYGDGAVGGVINIVTKSSTGSRVGGRVEAGFGSFKQREANVSAYGSKGPWSASAYGNGVNSDGYRVNNFYRQTNGTGDLRYTVQDGSAYLKISGDSQYVGLPGGRRVDSVTGLNQLLTDRTGAATPWDHAEKDGANVTAGVTRILMPGIEAIVDGGIRHKHEQGQFYNTPTPPASPTTDPSAAVDTKLTTVSFTPRINFDRTFGSLPWKATGGIDYYRAKYGSDRPQSLGGPPVDRYDLTQSTLAAYWQQTVSVLPTTDISFGGRIQGMTLSARDKFDIDAPGACFPGPPPCFPVNVEGTPFSTKETHKAFHVGAEHRFNDSFAVFGRAASSFRVPNVDERIGMATQGAGTPTSFDLRTQRSHDLEGGFRLALGRLNVQWSIYDMMLTDEIHFRITGAPTFDANNVNLDPTRRYGHETIASYAVNDDIRLKGGMAFTRAVFRQGEFAGNDIPLVSKYTGNVGVSWNAWKKFVVFDGIVRYVGPRRMDNDQTNLQPRTPAATLVDVRVGGEYDKFFWSLAVQNLFNLNYFDYSIASPYPNGFGSSLNTYNAYPMPGRSYMFKAGMTY